MGDFNSLDDILNDDDDFVDPQKLDDLEDDELGVLDEDFGDLDDDEDFDSDDEDLLDEEEQE